MNKSSGDSSIFNVQTNIDISYLRILAFYAQQQPIKEE